MSQWVKEKISRDPRDNGREKAPTGSGTALHWWPCSMGDRPRTLPGWAPAAPLGLVRPVLTPPPRLRCVSDADPVVLPEPRSNAAFEHRAPRCWIKDDGGGGGGKPGAGVVGGGAAQGTPWCRSGSYSGAGLGLRGRPRSESGLRAGGKACGLLLTQAPPPPPICNGTQQPGRVAPPGSQNQSDEMKRLGCLLCGTH